MKKSLILSILLTLAAPSFASEIQPGLDPLYEQFLNPDKGYRPRVWWHWMNGNVTKDGIRKDLEWMDRAGIAGFHNFDAGMSSPQIVEKRLAYMTPEWKDAFNYALDLADSLGMEVSIASSPGWSITGGPWVTPEDAEKKLVWREMVCRGGGRVRGRLPEPFINSGPYQDILGYPDEPHKFEYYRDLFVLAVPVTGAELSTPAAEISTSGSGADSALLSDGELMRRTTVMPGSDGFAWVRLDYPEPVSIRSMRLSGLGNVRMCLEASVDGETFVPVVPELMATSFLIADVSERSFAPVEARSFRFRALEPGENLVLAEAELFPYSRVDCALVKAGFYTNYRISDRYPTPEAADALPLRQVLDITRYCHDGEFDWDAPEGTWRLMRFGWNLLGRRNGPASPEATGLEVDKLDGDAVRRYYDNYLGMYEDASGGRLGKAIQCLMIDSYESGKATWTLDMEREFRTRRGYSMRPWAPVLAGYVVGSAEQSEQFLFDWRQTLGELMAENHYDIVNDILAEYGMIRHTESHEERTAFVGDGMMVKRKADIPMSAIWARFGAGWYSSYVGAEADVRESSSVAHIYGQNVCAAESFTTNGTIGKWDGTGAYQCSPSRLKPLADAAMALGLNRFIIHTSVHQPVDDKVPGLGLGPYGQWFNRHDTWAEEARPWTDYLSRSCYLMQQGRWVADIAYFYGEDKNLTGRFYEERVDIPRGWNFDFVNADILLNVLRVKDRALVTGSGMRYRMLVLDDEIRYMSLPVLRRVLRFARAGVAIYGPRPEAKAGRKGSMRRFERVAARIWDRGRANVYGGVPLASALEAAGIPADVDFLAAGGEDVRFVHRSLPEAEMYWIANITPDSRDLTVSLAVSGLSPEIWHADTGVREPASYRIEGGRTLVELHMVPDDAQFILLSGSADVQSRIIPAPEVKELCTVYGAWDVSFQSGRGAPESTTLMVLKSLSECEEEGIRYFSGTAAYSKTFLFGPLPERGSLFVDLGDVHHMARVFLNGTDLGLAWKTPYRVDATGVLREGWNDLRIEVTDSWANRLIGDAKKPLSEAVTYTPHQFYLPTAEPIPSGLVGPVRVLGVDAE